MKLKLNDQKAAAARSLINRCDDFQKAAGTMLLSLRDDEKPQVVEWQRSVRNVSHEFKDALGIH